MTASNDSSAARTELHDRARELIAYADRFIGFDQLPWYGGNNSVRVGDDLLITRTVVARSGQSPEDACVLQPIAADAPTDPTASSALPIHQAIYRRTGAGAVLHSHPFHATLLSFYRDSIEPVDENGLLYLGPAVPVVAAPVRNGWNLVADELAEALTACSVVVLKWHGVFSIGPTLSDAMHQARAVEHAARFIVTLAREHGGLGTPTFPPEQVAETLGGT